MRVGLPVLVLWALVAAGCGSAQGEADGPPVPTRPQLSPPATVVDCGRYENLNRPGGPTEEERAADRCFLDAFEQGRPAALVVTRATVEGDPITTFLRVLPGGRISSVVDGTQDSFGSGEWAAYECTGLSAGDWLEPTGCEQVELPDELPGQG